MIHVHRWLPAATTLVAVALAAPAAAEVRSSTLGVDTNCPSGLSE